MRDFIKDVNSWARYISFGQTTNVAQGFVRDVRVLVLKGARHSSVNEVSLSGKSYGFVGRGLLETASEVGARLIGKDIYSVVAPLSNIELDYSLE